MYRISKFKSIASLIYLFSFDSCFELYINRVVLIVIRESVVNLHDNFVKNIMIIISDEKRPLLHSPFSRFAAQTGPVPSVSATLSRKTLYLMIYEYDTSYPWIPHPTLVVQKLYLAVQNAVAHSLSPLVPVYNT